MAADTLTVKLFRGAVVYEAPEGTILPDQHYMRHPTAIGMLAESLSRQIIPLLFHLLATGEGGRGAIH